MHRSSLDSASQLALKDGLKNQLLTQRHNQATTRKLAVAVSIKHLLCAAKV